MLGKWAISKLICSQSIDASHPNGCHQLGLPIQLGLQQFLGHREASTGQSFDPMAPKCPPSFLSPVFNGGWWLVIHSSGYLCQALFPLEEEPCLLAHNHEQIAKLGSTCNLEIKQPGMPGPMPHGACACCDGCQSYNQLAFAQNVCVLFADSLVRSEINTEGTNRWNLFLLCLILPVIVLDRLDWLVKL
jgi:hypothetical protein